MSGPCAHLDDWRGRILKEFTPKIAPLTLVADPDGLLLEETLLEVIRERGFEILPFDDSVAFRFAYESRFRSRWDRGETADLVVVVPAESHQLATLPYDLLRAGRQLSFGLGELLPRPQLSGGRLARPRAISPLFTVHGCGTGRTSSETTRRKISRCCTSSTLRPRSSSSRLTCCPSCCGDITGASDCRAPWMTA